MKNRFPQSADQRILQLENELAAKDHELQIVAALEKVRARTISMQKSNELPEIAHVLFQQFKELGATPLQITIGIINEKERVFDFSVTESGGTGRGIEHPFKGSFDEPALLKKLYGAWKEREKSYTVELEGKELLQWIEYRNKLTGTEGNLPSLDDKKSVSAAFFSKGVITFSSNTHPSDETIRLSERFASVFDQTYTRFLDLQKAEAQAREAQIETAVERVRSRSLGMHKSEELQDVVNTVFERLKALEIDMNVASIFIFKEGSKDWQQWVATSTTNYSSYFHIPYVDLQIFRDLEEAKKSGKDFYSKRYSFEQKNEWFNYAFANTEYSRIPGDRKKFLIESEFFQVSFALAKNTGIQLAKYSGKNFTEKENEILLRFSRVFEQAYTRFLDLQKAEAQAREAQIEAALERVRAGTMAMHHSNELDAVIKTVYAELKKLDVSFDRCFIMIFDEHKGATWWMGSPDDVLFHEGFYVPFHTHPPHLAYLKGWEERDQKWEYLLAGQVKKDWDEFIFKETELSKLPPVVTREMSSYDYARMSASFENFGCLTAGGRDWLSDESFAILNRFAKVFDQAYTRFVDLQKAEAQAREAQIEAALERIRAKTMAMHESAQLAETAKVFFEQFDLLGQIPDRMSIGIFKEEINKLELWVTDQHGNQVNDKYYFSLDEPTSIAEIHKAWKDRKDICVVDLTGKTLEQWLQYVKNKAMLPIDETKIKGRRVQQTAFFSKGCLLFTTHEPVKEQTMQLLVRFARVFDLTYTRFLDLQKAEAQAREAKIEAALEKVRGKAMAMHNSTDLSSAASMVFTELRKLGINPIRCGVGLLNKESRKAQLYSATSSPAGDSLSLVGWVMLSEHPVLEKIYDSWLQNEDYFPELSGEQLKSYYKLLLKGLPVKVPEWQDAQKEYGHFLSFSVGCLYAWSDVPYNDSEIKILKRFATIIDLTFRRYIELQKAETNAQEAIKRASLDRVRAETASMRTTADLEKITPLIWNELTTLAVPFIRCGVFIMDEEAQQMNVHLSTPEGTAIAAFRLPYNAPGNFSEIVSQWHRKESYISHWDKEEFNSLADSLVEQGAVTTKDAYLDSLPKEGIYLHFLPFLQGMLYVGNVTKLGTEEVDLIQSVADAFSTAYARYEDFNKLEAAKKQVDVALDELQATQKQLIQSEKMASLGELTAGIAHEIQNPLNFVNNFSEVNRELILEMKEEIDKGNLDEVKAIAADIEENEEKINHHGKRADAIVKGMLQHSRASTGKKEPTDINALCDEYLRLSYHGLRAKDKSFNALIQKDFDDSTGKINIVPQDIGRVLLNLFNNAFYAVTEKKNQLVNKEKSGISDEYQPIVSLSTRKSDNHVTITVRDNGNGIPKNIVDKIFQPFFTTKPTGSGTGLGLSLSYDIVKAHEGEVKVESKEGEETTFIITLPV